MKCAFVYVTDERGMELAKHSVVSVALSQNNRSDIHIFCYRFSPKDSSQFAAVLEPLNSTITFHTINDLGLEHYKTCGHVTTPTLLKLAAVSELISSYDRIVYLDNDILVFDNLDIGAINFGTAPLAAVIDMDLSGTGALRESVWASEGGIASGLGGYLNAGVMIFDASNWHDARFQKEYAEALDRHDAACPFKLDCTSIDQCAINSAFENNWAKLPLSYNMQASAKFTSAWRTAPIRHYCGMRKAVPISLFRNDGRDVRYLNKVRVVLGLPVTWFPWLYEIAYRFNALRNYRKDARIRRYMRAVGAETTVSKVRVAERQSRTFVVDRVE